MISDQEINSINNLIKSGKYTEAIDEINHYNRESSSDYRLNFLLGKIYTKQFRLDKSIEQYEKALSIDEKNTEVLTEMGWTLYELGKYNRSIQVFGKAMKYGSNDTFIYEGIALSLVNLNETPAAVKIHEKLLDTSKDKASQYYTFGFFYYLIGEYDSALIMYNKSLNLRPKDVKTLIEIGRILTYKEKYVGAINSFEKAVAIDENNHYIYNKLGWVNRRMGRLNESISMYSKSLELRPDNLNEAHNELARLYLVKGMEKEAIKILELSNKIAPYNLWAKNQLLKINMTTQKDACANNQLSISCKQFSNGEYNQAIESFTSLNESDEPLVLIKKAMIYSFQDEWDKATEILLYIIKKDSNNAAAYNELGWIYFNKYDFIRMNDSLNEANRIYTTKITN